MLAQLPEFQDMALMPRILRRSLKLEDYHHHRLSCHSHSNIRHGATLGGHWVLYLVSACSVELTASLFSGLPEEETLGIVACQNIMQVISGRDSR